MLGVSDYGAFVLAFILLLFLPGPGNLALVNSTAMGGLTGGKRRKRPMLLGRQPRFSCRRRRSNTAQRGH